MTVKELKEFLKNMPDNAVVLRSSEEICVESDGNQSYQFVPVKRVEQDEFYPANFIFIC